MRLGRLAGWHSLRYSMRQGKAGRRQVGSPSPKLRLPTRPVVCACAVACQYLIDRCVYVVFSHVARNDLPSKQQAASHHLQMHTRRRCNHSRYSWRAQTPVIGCPAALPLHRPRSATSLGPSKGKSDGKALNLPRTDRFRPKKSRAAETSCATGQSLST